MKEQIKYGIGCLMMAWMITGCQQDETVEPSFDSIEDYIFFNTEVTSRGELVTEMNGLDFGVMGYEYSGDWNTVKVQAIPNLFYAQSITWNPTSEVHEYTPLKIWRPGNKYTFFGYYPTTGVELSEEDIEGVPYLTYTLPETPVDMKDVMTAVVYDTDNSASNSVGLTFQHRLVATNVQARNFNIPHDGKEVYIKLTDVRITYTNLKYNKVTLPLDASLPITREKVGTVKQDYTILTNADLLIPPTDTSTGETTAVEVSAGQEPPTTLILIPQEGTDEANDYLKGTVTFTFDYADAGGNTITIDDVAEQPGTRTLNFDLGKSIVAGRKYALLMNFSRTSVTIAIVESGEWTDQDVEIEFE